MILLNVCFELTIGNKKNKISESRSNALFFGGMGGIFCIIIVAMMAGGHIHSIIVANSVIIVIWCVSELNCVLIHLRLEGGLCEIDRIDMHRDGWQIKPVKGLGIGRIGRDGLKWLLS
jgi:hypothetical protein